MASHAKTTPVVSDAIFNTVNKTFVIPVNILTATLGILSNVVNIVVFAKMTPMDTMTISLTGLAVSDLLFSCSTLPHFIISAAINNGVKVLWNIDLKALTYLVFVWQRPLFHKISITITMFVSCERSLCVVKPFLVKNIFTKRRVIVIIMGIFSALTALFIPVFATGTLRRAKTGNSTSSTLVVHLAPGRDIAEQVVLLSAGFPLVLICQVVIFISSVFMATGLRRHQRFREISSSSGQGGKKKEKEHSRQAFSTSTPDETKLSTDSPSHLDNDLKATGSKLETNKSASNNPASSLKEDRLIQTVLVLAVMTVVLNTPLLINYIYYNVNSEFRVNEKFGNIYMIVADMGTFLQSLNAVLNIVVYLILNTKFRKLFKKIFCYNWI